MSQNLVRSNGFCEQSAPRQAATRASETDDPKPVMGSLSLPTIPTRAPQPRSRATPRSPRSRAVAPSRAACSRAVACRPQNRRRKSRCRQCRCGRVRVRIVAFGVADPLHSSVCSRRSQSESSRNRTGYRDRPACRSRNRASDTSGIHPGACLGRER